LWRFRATGAEAADSAASRVRICAATERVYVAAADSVASVSLEFERGVQRHRRVRTDLGEVRPVWSKVGRTRCGASVAGSKRSFVEMSVGGQVPSHTSGPENDRPVRDLPLIYSTVKYAGSVHYPKASQVTDIVVLDWVWTCQAVLVRSCEDHDVRARLAARTVYAQRTVPRGKAAATTTAVRC